MFMVQQERYTSFLISEILFLINIIKYVLNILQKMCEYVP